MVPELHVQIGIAFNSISYELRGRTFRVCSRLISLFVYLPFIHYHIFVGISRFAGFNALLYLIHAGTKTIRLPLDLKESSPTFRGSLREYGLVLYCFSAQHTVFLHPRRSVVCRRVSIPPTSVLSCAFTYMVNFESVIQCRTFLRWSLSRNSHATDCVPPLGAQGIQRLHALVFSSRVSHTISYSFFLNSKKSIVWMVTLLTHYITFITIQQIQQIQQIHLPTL